MIENTLIIVGPGGVGKGPLGKLIRDDAVALDPYRLRADGPRRDSEDPLYAPPKLRTELHIVLGIHGDIVRTIPCDPERMEWFPKSRVLFFTVRGEWQCLILCGLDSSIAKAELYAPVLPAVLAIPEIGGAVGSVRVLILNPSQTPLCQMADWTDLQKKTRENCEKRGDSPKSVNKRVESVPIEAPAWRTLAGTTQGRELVGWPFPEHRFKTEDNTKLLREARKHILDRYPVLDVFFKGEDEL